MTFEATQTSNGLGATGITGSFALTQDEIVAAFKAANDGTDPDGIQLGYDLEVKWGGMKLSQRAAVIAAVIDRAEKALDAQQSGAQVRPEPAGTNP